MLRCFSCSKTVLVFWICSFSVIHSLTCTANSCKPSSSLQIVRLTTHWTRRNEKKKLILPKICCHNAMWCHPTGRSIGQSITLRHAFPLSGDNSVFLTKDAGIAAVMTLPEPWSVWRANKLKLPGSRFMRHRRLKAQDPRTVLNEGLFSAAPAVPALNLTVHELNTRDQ